MIVSLSLLTGFSLSHAQRIKYKDLVPVLDSLKEDEAIPMLIELLQTERDNPNANFRLGLLYAKKYKATDPLKEFEKSIEYANRTKLQMIKSKAIIDNREVNRNSGWYAPLATEVKGNKVEFIIIQQQIDNEYNLADAFTNNIPPAYASFTKAVFNYDKAKKTYADIAQKYASIKELCLLYNQDIETRMRQLQFQYDSTYYYFNQYNSLKAGTIIAYDQKLVVKPINVYRKDGLATQTDFFTQKIDIWNYRKWAEEVINEVNSSVVSLRENLQSNYEKISKSVEVMESGTDVEQFATIDKQLLFTLGRMDYRNALVPMLQYNQFLQEYLSRKRELSGLESDTAIVLQTKLQLYTLLLYENIKADSLLADLVEKSQDDAKLKRHEEFLIQNFGSPEGFKKMALDEKQKVEAEYANFVTLIKQAVTKVSMAEEVSGNTITHQRMNLSLLASPNPVDSLVDNKPVTAHTELNPDGSRYLAGVIRRNTKTRHVEVFVCKVDSRSRVSWMKFFDLQMDNEKSLSNHIPTAIRATQKGVLIAINSVRMDSTASMNNLVYLSDTGEELLSVRVNQEASARFINYQENTRSFVITYYDPQIVNGTLEIINVTDTGTVVWDKKMIFTGTLNQVLNVHEGIVLAGTGILWKSDKTELRKNQPALFIARLNLNGEILGEKMVEGFRLEKAYKVNDSNISLMSSLGAAEGPPGSTDFIITNSSLELIYPRKD